MSTVNPTSSGYSPSALLSQLESGSPQAIGSLLSGNRSTGAGTSANSSTGDSAQISEAGQLYSQLQQLQQQNPTQFKQVTAQIAGQLQSASQQATGTQATFLSNLADKFQTASQTGSAAPLAPSNNNAPVTLNGADLTALKSSSSHHGHHAHGGGGYNQQGQATSTTTTSTSSSSSTSDSSSSDANLGQLFTSITQEVSQTLGSSAN